MHRQDQWLQQWHEVSSQRCQWKSSLISPDGNDSRDESSDPQSNGLTPRQWLCCPLLADASLRGKQQQWLQSAEARDMAAQLHTLSPAAAVIDPTSKHQPSSFSATTCRRPLFGAQRNRSSKDESGGKPEEGLLIMQPARCLACLVKPQSCLPAQCSTSRKAATRYWKKPGSHSGTTARLT